MSRIIFDFFFLFYISIKSCHSAAFENRSREGFLMAYVAISDKGYTCFSDSHSTLFSEDSSHNLLFEFTFKDLSFLQTLFMQHVSACINVDTLELADNECKIDTSKMIEDIVKSVHPYYKDIYTTIIIEEIGRYFNDLLLFSVYTAYKIKESVITKDWYTKRIASLLSPWMQPIDTYPTKFYNEFQEQICADGYYEDPSIEYVAFIKVVTYKPIGFEREISDQRLIRNMLYYILDIAADQSIADLTIPQRMWLCDNMFDLKYKKSQLTIERTISYNSPCQSFHEESAGNVYDLFFPVLHLDCRDLEKSEISESKKEHLRLAIESARRVQSTEYTDEYKVDNLHQLLYLEVMAMVQDGVMIRKCKNCGKYFVVHNRKTFYCDRVNELGERCSAVGTFKNFQRKVAMEEPLKIYTRAYKTHFARFKKGTITREELTEWRLEGKKKLEQVRNGNLDISDFAQWLKK